MEKRLRSYDLETIKAAFSNPDKLRITGSALRDARAMGVMIEDIVNAIQKIKISDFVKSMTTYANHRVWQDVYNIKFKGFLLYIKFQKDEDGYFVISFKEK